MATIARSMGTRGKGEVLTFKVSEVGGKGISGKPYPFETYPMLKKRQTKTLAIKGVDKNGT